MSNKWFGERVPGEKTNYQKAVQIMESFTHYPLIFRVGKTIYGSGIFKIEVMDSQIPQIEGYIKDALTTQIPAFTKVMIKTDKPFNLISFKCKIKPLSK